MQIAEGYERLRHLPTARRSGHRLPMFCTQGVTGRDGPHRGIFGCSNTEPYFILRFRGFEERGLPWPAARLSRGSNGACVGCGMTELGVGAFAGSAEPRMGAVCPFWEAGLFLPLYGVRMC